MTKNNAECTHEGYPVTEEHLGRARPLTQNAENVLKTSKITPLSNEGDWGSMLDNLQELSSHETAVGSCSNCGTKLYERPEEGTSEFYEWQKNGPDAPHKFTNGTPVKLNETFSGLPDFHTWATKLTKYSSSKKLSKQFDKIIRKNFSK